MQFVVNNMRWELYLNYLLAMLALLNPISRLPFWKEMTGDKDASTRRKIAFFVTLSGFIILLIFLFTGQPLLKFFSVDLSVFKIAGGILLLISGISMIEGRMTQLEDREEEGSVHQVAIQRFKKVIVPLTVPMIAGPGSITTAVLYGGKAEGIADYAILAGMTLVMMVILYVTFTISGLAERRINELVFVVLTRIFGIIVTAIGVQFIVEGLGEVFPAWLNENSDIQDNINKQAE